MRRCRQHRTSCCHRPMKTCLVARLMKFVRAAGTSSETTTTPALPLRCRSRTTEASGRRTGGRGSIARLSAESGQPVRPARLFPASSGLAGVEPVVLVDGAHDVPANLAQLPGLSLGQRVEDQAADLLGVAGRGFGALCPAHIVSGMSRLNRVRAQGSAARRRERTARCWQCPPSTAARSGRPR